MLVNIPDAIIQEMVDANIIQQFWSVKTADLRWNHVHRLTYHVWEYVLALIGKEMRNRKMLPPPDGIKKW